MFKRARLPIGISSFPDLRNAGKIYIDKTALIGELAEGFSYVFLSRPRRFGKSLLVSTLASLFEHGLRDFKGLAIEKTWQEKTYPVVKLDFSTVTGVDSIDKFSADFNQRISDAFAHVGFVCNPSSERNALGAFRSFLQNQKTPFVLLIDEYDAPLTRNLNNPELFEQIRVCLRDFFAILKACSGALRFLFITGITKYRQVSIFSELNNIQDISLDPQFGELLGYTREEIEASFPEFLDNAVQSLNEETGETYTRESLMDEMIANYDGFCFDEQAKMHVLAPWSVLNFLAAPHNGFENYWIASGGVSTWLENWIATHGGIDTERFNKPITLDIDKLGMASKPSDVSADVLLFQTGYLSIVGTKSPSYVVLGYPNEEVSTAMAKLYLHHVSKLDDEGLCNIMECLSKGSPDDVVKALNKLYLSIPYDGQPIRNEAGARAIVFVYAKGAGLLTLAECHNAMGSSDLETTVGDRHWVFEFKFVTKDAEAEKALVEAIDQIREKHYGETTDAKELIRLGVVYSGETRRIVAYEKLDE